MLKFGGERMSVSVGQHIQSMIDHMEKGEIELAFSDVCIAVDITSQKHFNETQSSASCYKRFLKENIWMIVVTGMGSLITEKMKLPFVHKDIISDAEGYCTLEQIIYHVMRCGLIHGTGEENKIIWNSSVPLAIDANGNLNISPSFIWGLALTVITCSANKNEHVNDTCWISMASFKYLINDLWGKRESIKTMIKSQYNVTIKERYSVL